ncbi:DUF4918 family protein [bacterium SCSIO 12741]|nr:DUF4918 family protein [bacterium SCSIO 12741]
MSTAAAIKQFIDHLVNHPLQLDECEVMNPFLNSQTRAYSDLFWDKYYTDDQPRYALWGINPGRLGSGITGVGFTDPVNLEEKLGIKNDLPKRHELSSRFIYEVIQAFGGPEAFFGRFYISSVLSLGLLRDGKNINYYDIPGLPEKLKPLIVDQINRQLPFLRRDVTWCIGKGKNLKYLEKWNKEYQWFDTIEVVPHPRWVMQYRLKRMDEFVDEYLQKLAPQ